MSQHKLLTATLVLTALLLVMGLMPIRGEAEIYNTVVRLHVLANSDSEGDQALKLRVRDAILTVTTPLLEGVSEQSDAIARLEENMDTLRAAAEEVIASEGRKDTVSLLIGLEDYPRKTYDSFCFPAGEYVSLRVLIGEGEGQNWWCCLFPPLCLGAATVSRDEAEDACISVGLTPDQYKIITQSDRPVYRVRFRLLELLQELW